VSTALLTAYILVWPVLVAGVLVTLIRGFLKDFRDAKKAGETLI
jgi:hypothetical protein